jgi:hypothetical protein
MAGRWNKVHAGFYERIASDGATVIAQVSRQDNGKWAYTVRPFGRMELGWQITNMPTMTRAQSGAEGGYRSYMTKHREMNSTKEN